MSSNNGSIQKVTRRDFFKMGTVAGASAILAACAPSSSGGGSGGAALPDLTSGNSILLGELATAAKTEGLLTTIALPHDCANYGEIIETFKTKCGLTINELNPDAGSADELIEGIQIEGELVLFPQWDRHRHAVRYFDHGFVGWETRVGVDDFIARPDQC